MPDELLALQNEIKRLISLFESQVEIQNAEAKSPTIEAEQAESPKKSEPSEVDIKVEDADDIRTDEDSGSEESGEPSVPLWDEKDLVFRCPLCSGEALDGLCQFCGAELDFPEHSTNLDQAAALTFVCSSSTMNAAESEDRCLVPRGNTPLLSPHTNTPHQYFSREDEYWSLRRRGATRKMCITFCLTFKHATGIEATLPEDIREIFAGPDIAEEDLWYVALGRRVDLDEEDADGRDFVIGLLEDALLFSSWSFTTGPKIWETVQVPERGGMWGRKVWVTRPKESWLKKLAKEAISDDDSDLDLDSEESDKIASMEERLLDGPFVESGPTLHRDEYESTDSESEEEDDSSTDVREVEEGSDAEDDYVSDPGYEFNVRNGDGDWINDARERGLVPPLRDLRVAQARATTVGDTGDSSDSEYHEELYSESTDDYSSSSSSSSD